MNVVQAKQLDLVDYLASLGYFPEKSRGYDHWYCSPLREEKKASFKVDRKNNVWYDHGLGLGGNFVDFAVRYHKCSVKELLDKLGTGFSFHQQPANPIRNEASLVKIITERDIVTLPLIRYLKRRKINIEISKKYCREVAFSLHNKQYFALGFKNDLDGYELRNEWFKGSSSPKAITSFKTESRELAVFEGFLDFLSYLTISSQRQSSCNFLILNSAAFFERSRQFMELHDSVSLFLDNDKTGHELTRKALSWSNKFLDKSNLYKGYKDFNDWIVQISQSKKRGLHL